MQFPLLILWCAALFRTVLTHMPGHHHHQHEGQQHFHGAMVQHQLPPDQGRPSSSSEISGGPTAQGLPAFRSSQIDPGLVPQVQQSSEQDQANVAPPHSNRTPPFQQLQGESNSSPFDPRFSVSREEVSDEAWATELVESFRPIVPSVLLPNTPAGVVNVNYGAHNCVHLGTELEAEISAYEPSEISYPANKDKEYLMLLVDMDNGNYIHWMLINIPGSKVQKGDVVAEYSSPAPVGNWSRYLFLVLEQSRHLSVDHDLTVFQSRSCQNRGRTGFPRLQEFAARFGLSQPVAANFFIVRHDAFVDSIVAYCADQQQQ